MNRHLGQFRPNILPLQKDRDSAFLKPFNAHFDEDVEARQRSRTDGVDVRQGVEDVFDPASMNLDRGLCFT